MYNVINVRTGQVYGVFNSFSEAVAHATGPDMVVRPARRCAA
jgi:hypothetical protein